MPLSEIDISFFKKSPTLGIAECSHEITEGTLPYEDGSWVCKKAKGSLSARHELLTQELFRLMIPGQPRTYIATNKARGSLEPAYYILSEKINGFVPLPRHHQDRFVNEQYTGLGRVLMACIFLHEIDLNLDNIGLDSQNVVRKIDGDWGMAALILPELSRGITTDITSKLIDDLPFLDHYFIYNWLDIIFKKKNHASSVIVSQALSTASGFRMDVNQTILIFLLLPRMYMQRFIALYLPELHVERFLDAFLARQQELMQSAINNASFVDFLKSPLADQTMRDHLSYVCDFTAHRWLSVVDSSDYAQVSEAFEVAISSLRQRIELMEHPSPLTVFGLAANSPILWGGGLGVASQSQRLGLFKSTLKRVETSVLLSSQCYTPSQFASEASLLMDGVMSEEEMADDYPSYIVDDEHDMSLTVYQPLSF